MEQLEKYLDKKYVLKSGRLLYFKGVHYNNDTLTDKIAEAAVKQYPAYGNKFLTERERAVVGARVAARNAIKGAESVAADENVEKRIVALIESGDLEGAKDALDELKVDETKELFLKDIEKAESEAEKEKAKEKAKPKAKEPAKENEKTEEKG